MSAAPRHCDGCEKLRRDVRSCGRDSNGDPDAPDLCFLCRAENARGRSFDRARGRYISDRQRDAEHDAETARIVAELMRPRCHRVGRAALGGVCRERA